MSTLKKPKQRVLFQSPNKRVCATGGSMLAASTSCLTPSCNLKSHPLQKSVSSSSLLSSTKLASKTIHASGSPHDTRMSPTPISRHNSDLTQSQPVHYQSSGYKMPLKFTPEVGTQVIVDKKSVNWDEMCLLELEEISDNCTPGSDSTGELKSRYKSEPNLSSIVSKQKCGNVNTPTVPKNLSALTLTRKLIKGVSMGNLKFPFSSHADGTKRLVKRRSAEGIQRLEACGQAQSLDDLDLDDETFEDNSADQLGSEEEETEDESSTSSEAQHEHENEHEIVENMGLASDQLSRGRRQSGCYRHLLLQHQNSLQRNLELLTSTPSTNLGRRSMSPITKSAQRMPKAMQV